MTTLTLEEIGFALIIAAMQVLIFARVFRHDGWAQQLFLCTLAVGAVCILVGPFMS